MTAGILPVFRGSKFFSNAGVGQINKNLRVELNDFVSRDLYLASTQNYPQEAQGDTADDSSSTLVRQFLGYLQVTFENIGSLGDSVVEQGVLWSVSVDPSSADMGKPVRLRTENDLSWPILEVKNNIIYALKTNQIQRLEPGKPPTGLTAPGHWIKLIGVSQGTILGIIEDEQGKNRLARYTPGKGTNRLPFPRSEEEYRQLAVLEQENRSYAGNRMLYVDRSSRGGRGFDVFYKDGEQIFNLSDCGHDRCGQPSLSPDIKRVLFVRESRY